MNAEETHGLALEFALASALASYPDAEVEATVRELSGPLEERGGPGAQFVRALAAEGGFDALRSSYVDTFDRGDERAPLYETEYGRMRGMSKGPDLADISGFYRAFGLALDAESHEMPDHIAVELEFYAVLLAKQLYLDGERDREGSEIVLQARKAFLRDHLGPLAGAVASRLAATTGSTYGDLFAWCGSLVARECAALGVAPVPLDFHPDPGAKEEMKCAALHLPVLP